VRGRLVSCTYNPPARSGIAGHPVLLITSIGRSFVAGLARFSKSLPSLQSWASSSAWSVHSDIY
jgi:hypothetical protein